MHRTILSPLLARDNINVFDEFLRETEAYFTRSVSSVQEMKDRDNKKKKGDYWEAFCKDWMIASGKYINVWLLNEFNAEFQSEFMKQDNGIDIIAQDTHGWIAVQCKYRGHGKYVDWKSLSTFIGLCERTGPWNIYLVMTNCRGVTRKVPKTPKDRSICYVTFKNTTREHWMKMIGTYQPHTLREETTTVPTTLEELRAARLTKFEKN